MVSVIDTLAAVEARPDVLVHTPHIGHVGDDANTVKRIASAGIPMTSTLQVFVPHFGADNTPLFRDGQPFPWNTLEQRATAGERACCGKPGSARLRHRHHLAAEAVARRRAAGAQPCVLAARHQQDHGPGAARSTLKQDQIGTLEPGKLADIVLIDGNPLANLNDLLKVVLTIKSGRIVSDTRSSANGRANR